MAYGPGCLHGEETGPRVKTLHGNAPGIIKHAMTRLFIRHKVKNYAKWRDAFDAFKKTRKAGGEKSFKIGHTVGQPNNLCLLFTWESADKARAFLRSKELKATMQEAGVKEKPEIHIFEDKD